MDKIKESFFKLGILFFSYKGKINRKSYFLYILCLVPIFIFQAMIGSQSALITTAFLKPLTVIVHYSIFCLSIKRIRDLKKSTWHILQMYLPLLFGALLFILFFPEGGLESIDMDNLTNKDKLVLTIPFITFTAILYTLGFMLYLLFAKSKK